MTDDVIISSGLSFWVSLDCVSDFLPCTMDKSERFDGFVDGTINRISLAAVVVWKIIKINIVSERHLPVIMVCYKPKIKTEIFSNQQPQKLKLKKQKKKRYLIWTLNSDLNVGWAIPMDGDCCKRFGPPISDGGC